MAAPPPTRYARSGDARIAFQVMGTGPPDLVSIGGPASHLDLQWEDPQWVRNRKRFASYARSISFDRRGTGLSDPVDRPATLEQQVDDLQAVLDAAGVRRVALLGAVEFGVCAMYAASHPDRVSALVLVNVGASGGIALDEQRRKALLDVIENHWGEGRLASLFAPEHARDDRFAGWWTRFERSAVTPAMARKLLELNLRVDLSGVLPAIRVPTLVLHRTGNPLIPLELGRETAALIPGARFVEAPGTDVYNWPGPDDPESDLIEEFITGRRARPSLERVLATVLFTDIVGSTERAAELGDRAWSGLREHHNALVRDKLERYRGTEVKTIGDGFLARFDGPARAIHCAREIVEATGDLGLSLRCGLHTGECELLDGDLGGIAVHIGARVGALAQGAEVLVSSTVRDLVVGSELEFEDRGAHELRGVPGEWRLWALRDFQGAGAGRL